MSKNLKARIVSGGILTAFFLGCLIAAHEAPTISAESKSINEQDVCSKPVHGETTKKKDQKVEFFKGYTTTVVNVRDYPDTKKGKIINRYDFNTEFTYCLKSDSNWGIILNPTEDEEFGFICLEYTSDEPQQWDGPILNSVNGVNYGPSGKETYYNLPMGLVVSYMQDLGYEGEYWVRADGAKMFGDYVMVAADLNVYPKGTIIETSLGKSIVCDTGDFCKMNTGVKIDVAVNWR